MGTKVGIIRLNSRGFPRRFGRLQVVRRLVVNVGWLAYRLAMLALAVLGLGLATDAYVTDTINRYYFRAHHPGSTILIWAGVAVAVASVLEGVFLVVRRRMGRDASQGTVFPDQP